MLRRLRQWSMLAPSAPSALIAAIALTGCGSETTDLIPAIAARPNEMPDGGSAPPTGSGGSVSQDCVDSSAYPGDGLYKADVADASDMTLNGSAAVADGRLRLNDERATAVGSAYFSESIAFDASLSVYAHFSFAMGGGDGLEGADGLAFVLQSDSRGPKALGWLGYGQGYKGAVPGVALEFDTFFNEEADDPSPSHVALISIEDSRHVAHRDPAFALNDELRRYVWIDYDRTEVLYEVFVAETPAKPSSALLVHSGFDLAGALGSQVFVGFSGSSGAHVNWHDIIGEMWFVASPLPKCR
jgi:hypothetical protein